MLAVKKPTTDTTFMYFAYGSNMLTSRLTAQDRAPSAVKVGIGFLDCRRLTFDKLSQDGSGKCDAEWTEKDSDRVYGVIFTIKSKDEEKLDKAEGLNNGYKKESVTVFTNDGSVNAVTYIATKKETVLRPYRWYKALTVAGAVEHNLPRNYIEWLRTIEAVEDPNIQRREKNEKVLFTS